MGDERIRGGRYGPLPTPNDTGRPDSGPGSTRWRERHQVIGGYYMGQGETQTSPPIGGLSPASAVFAQPAQTFDPYRQGDMTRILRRQVNNGSLFDLQDSLVQSGLLGDRYTPGYLDANTTDAFNALLSIANQQGMDWRDVLSQAIQGGGTLGQQGGRPPPPDIVTLPNKDDLLYSAEQTGMDMTGHKLDEDLQDSIAESMLNAMRTQQERQYQKEISMGELNFTEDMPGERAQQRMLEEEIKRREPQKVAERGAQTARDIWFEGLAGPVG